MKRFLLVLALILLVAGCSKTKTDAAEKKFKILAVEYYEKELKGKVIGVSEYTVTLKTLKAKGYDVSGVVNKDTGKECDETSNVVITIQDGSYDTKVNLICN